ncbi:TetR/AcrR family transcriptional regulator [Galactobacter valiniphilus]|uniref:TetR/AcrR family transcriptional regulator n=1 Tax=Galactobacter valiniphilus TaxID=2676122 RepID=UPI0037355C46
MALSRDTVVETATRILREYGLGDLTMRRLARELGVQPGALYWHVASKQDLLVAVTESLMDTLPVHDDAAGLGDWLASTLLPVPDAADVVRVALAWRPEVVSALAAFEELAGAAGVGAGVAVRQAWARGALDLVLGAVADHQEGTRAAAARETEAPAVEHALERVREAMARWARA